jgi:hypothetical protein
MRDIIMKKYYSGIGIGLLLVCIVSLLGDFSKFVFALIIRPDSYYALLQFLSVNGLYGIVSFHIYLFLSTFLYFWGIAVAVILIKNNSYNKQLLWWVYALIGIKIFIFVLALPIGDRLFTELATGIIAYVFLIRHDNRLSRLIKNKTK